MNDAGFPILGYDVNNDGKMDVIYGQGHSYGIYWLEQIGEGDNRHWVRRAIDESFSQVHALKLIDIDGDGEPELLAGKRYRGHNGNDPGSYDPLVIYYYKIDRKTGAFSRYPVSVNGTAGAGTQFVVEDMDKDGDLDIVVAGKSGVHFLENLKVDPGAKGRAREGHRSGEELAVRGERGQRLSRKKLPRRQHQRRRLRRWQIRLPSRPTDSSWVSLKFVEEQPQILRSAEDSCSAQDDSDVDQEPIEMSGLFHRRTGLSQDFLYQGATFRPVTHLTR